MLDTIIHANQTAGNELFVMYDIACSLHSLLKTSYWTNVVLYVLICLYYYLYRQHIDQMYWNRLLCVYLLFIPLAIKCLVR